MRLRILEEDGPGRGGKIWIDGIERHDVESCTVWFEVNGITKADVTFFVSGLDVEVAKKS